MAEERLAGVVAGGTTIHIGTGACSCTTFGQCWACSDERDGRSHFAWHDEPATTTATASWVQLRFFPGGTNRDV